MYIVYTHRGSGGLVVEAGRMNFKMEKLKEALMQRLGNVTAVVVVGSPGGYETINREVLGWTYQAFLCNPIGLMSRQITRDKGR